jgi:hypothetical protein
MKKITKEMGEAAKWEDMPEGKIFLFHLKSPKIFPRP